MKLWMMAPGEGIPPLHSFLDNLEEKQRQKIFSLFALLLQVPEVAMQEPYVKHFGIERYQSLYELRAKSKNMIRIIFTRMENGDILFLAPFIKRRQRDTEKALEHSLRLLALLWDHPEYAVEYNIREESK
ncbi:type II toxin-antitoxin system RelE/ParE family toxin [Oscillospiraceae bacterium 50-16]